MVAKILTKNNPTDDRGVVFSFITQQVLQEHP
jgi:hypothetical protein